MHWVKYEINKYSIELTKQYSIMVQLNTGMIFDLVFLFGFFLLEEERVVTYEGAPEKVRENKYKNPNQRFNNVGATKFFIVHTFINCLYSDVTVEHFRFFKSNLIIANSVVSKVVSP